MPDKIISVFLALCILFMPNKSFGEVEQIEAVGIYIVGDGVEESPKIAKERAKREAIRVALDKAGIYIESFSEMKNFRLTKDEVKILAGEVIKVESVSYNVEILTNEIIRYTATIQAIVDTDIIETKIKELEETGGTFSDETERLRVENERLKADNEKLNAENYSDESEQAERYLIEGNEALKAGDYKTAIDCFGKALDLKKDYTDAVYSRAKVYDLTGQYDAALNDYSRLIKLTNSADAYYLRGSFYEKLGDFDNALKDFNTALEKSPKDKRIIRAREKLLVVKNSK